MTGEGLAVLHGAVFLIVFGLVSIVFDLAWTGQQLLFSGVALFGAVILLALFQRVIG